MAAFSLHPATAARSLRIAVFVALCCALAAVAASAEQIRPAQAVVRVVDGGLGLEIALQAEAILAGIDMSAHAGTDLAPEAAVHAELRALPATEVEDRFRAFWPEMAANIVLRVDGTPVLPEFRGLYLTETADPVAPRPAILRIGAALPPGAQTLVFGWAGRYGAVSLSGPAGPAAATIVPAGRLSDPVALVAPGEADPTERQQTLARALEVLRDALLPLLFALALCLPSARTGRLLLQAAALGVGQTLGWAAVEAGWVVVPTALAIAAAAAAVVAVSVDDLWRRSVGPLRVLIVTVLSVPIGIEAAGGIANAGAPSLGLLVVAQASSMILFGAALRAGRRPGSPNPLRIPTAIVFGAAGGWILYTALG